MLVRTNLESDEALSEQELYDMIMLAIFGGIDTTRNQIGLAMDVFIRNPAQWRLLATIPTRQIRRRGGDAHPPDDHLGDARGGRGFHLPGVEISGTTFTCSASRRHRSARLSRSVVRHHRRAQAAFRLRRRRAFLPRPFHRPWRHDRSARHSCPSRQEPRIAGTARFLPDSGNTGPVVLPIAFDAGERKAFIRQVPRRRGSRRASAPETGPWSRSHPLWHQTAMRSRWRAISPASRSRADLRRASPRSTA